MRATTTRATAPTPRRRAARAAAVVAVAGLALVGELGATADAASAATRRPAARHAAARRSARHRPARRRRAEAYPGSAAAPQAVHDAVVAAFAPADQERAFLIAWRESRWRMAAANGSCVGLFQLHRVHQQRAAELGFTWDQVRTDPTANATLAADIHARQGWSPWSTNW